MATITTDFNDVQVRNIDPHSPVTSENHNKLLKTFGTYHMYVKGFNIDFSIDSTTHQILATIEVGTAYVQYMVIETISPVVLEVTEYPCAMADLCVVLEYTYRAVKPVPIAYLKVIRSENFNPVNQLLLYSFSIGDWQSQPEINYLKNDWFGPNGDGHFTDHRNSLANTPTWANSTYLRLDGQNQASAILKMDGDPVAENDIVNKRYVDNFIKNHHELHNPYFVRKDGDSLSLLFNTVVEDITIARPSATLSILDKYIDKDARGNEILVDNGGLSISASGNSVVADITKNKFKFKVGDNIVSEIDSSGITGAVWNADMAEYFLADDSITTLPEEGTCICIHHGKAVISSDEGDPSVIGCVSYHPAYILGGSTDFNKEFKENQKIPVAVIGQIKNVPYYSDYNLETGGLLVSGKNGKFKVVSSYDPLNINGCIIGKAMNSVYPCYGDKFNRVDVVIK